VWFNFFFVKKKEKKGRESRRVFTEYFVAMFCVGVYFILVLITPVFGSYAPRIGEYYKISPRVNIRASDRLDPDKLTNALDTVDGLWGCFENVHVLHDHATRVESVRGISTPDVLFSLRCRDHAMNMTARLQTILPYGNHHYPVSWIANLHSVYHGASGADVLKLWTASGGPGEIQFDFVTGWVSMNNDNRVTSDAVLFSTSVFQLFAAMCNTTLVHTDLAERRILSDAVWRAAQTVHALQSMVEFTHISATLQCESDTIAKHIHVKTGDWRAEFFIHSAATREDRRDRVVRMLAGFVALVVPVSYSPLKTPTEIRRGIVDSVVTTHALLANFTGISREMIIDCASKHAWPGFPVEESLLYSAARISIPMNTETFFTGTDQDDSFIPDCELIGTHTKVTLIVSTRFAERWANITDLPDTVVPEKIKRFVRTVCGLVPYGKTDQRSNDKTVARWVNGDENGNEDGNEDGQSERISMQFAQSIHGTFSAYTPSNIKQRTSTLLHDEDPDRGNDTLGGVNIPFAYLVDTLKRDDSSSFRVLYTPKYMADITADHNITRALNPYDVSWMDPDAMLIRRRMPYMVTFPYTGARCRGNDSDGHANPACGMSVVVLLQAKQTMYESARFQFLTMLQEKLDQDYNVIPARVMSVAMHIPSILSSLFLSVTATTTDATADADVDA